MSPSGAGRATVDEPGAARPARFVRLGVDVGDARVGLARSDLEGLIATPVDTLPRETAAATIAGIVGEDEVPLVVVGLPRSLAGGEGPAAQKARAFCAEIIAACAPTGIIPSIRLVDERLTTVSAHQALHGAGRRGRKHRAVVDQVAAVMILQQALDQERATGKPAGELFEAPRDEEDQS